MLQQAPPAGVGRHPAAEEAERLGRPARAHAGRAAAPSLAAMVAEQLGILATVRGEYAATRGYQEESLAQYQALGLDGPACSALNNLGMLHLYERRWDDAEQAFRTAAAAASAGGHRALEAQVAVNLAELWLAQGALPQADAEAHGALALAERAGEGHAAGQAAKALGVVARERGRADAAAAHFAHAEAPAGPPAGRPAALAA